MSELTVIIVSYKSLPYLLECLESVFSADWESFPEVIVVENSPLGTLARDLSIQFPRVKLICNKENLGYAKANNQALNLVKTNNVLLLNPDTYLPKTGLNELLQFFHANPRIGMIGPKLIRPDGTLDPACRRNFPNHLDFVSRLFWLDRLFPASERLCRYTMSYVDPSVSCDVECISGAFMLVRMKAVQEVGLLDESFFLYAEDLDWAYRFILAGWRVFYFSELEVLHHKRTSALASGLDAVLAFYTANLQLYEKYYKYASNVALFGIVRSLILLRKWVAVFVWYLFKKWI